MYAMDALLLVTKDTITELDLMIIKAANELGQMVAVVRTHAVPSAESIMRDREVDPRTAVKFMREEVANNFKLQAKGERCRMFFCDRWLFNPSDAATKYRDHPIVKSLPGGCMDEVKLLEFLAEMHEHRSEVKNGKYTAHGQPSKSPRC